MRKITKSFLFAAVMAATMAGSVIPACAATVERLFGADATRDYYIVDGTTVGVYYKDTQLKVQDLVTAPAAAGLSQVWLVSDTETPTGSGDSLLSQTDRVVFTDEAGETVVDIVQETGVQLVADNIVVYTDSKPGLMYSELYLPYRICSNPPAAEARHVYMLGNPDTGKHIQAADSYDENGASFYYHRESSIEEGHYHIYTKIQQTLIIESEYTLDVRNTNLGNTFDGPDRNGGSTLNLTAAAPSAGTDGNSHGVMESAQIHGNRGTVTVPAGTMFFNPEDFSVVQNQDLSDEREFVFSAKAADGSTALAGGTADFTVNFDGKIFTIDVDNSRDLQSGVLCLDVYVTARRSTGFPVATSDRPARLVIEVQ